MILFKVTYDISQCFKTQAGNILPLPSNFVLKKKTTKLLDIQNANNSKNNVMSTKVHDIHFIYLLSNIIF